MVTSESDIPLAPAVAPIPKILSLREDETLFPSPPMSESQSPRASVAGSPLSFTKGGTSRSNPAAVALTTVPTVVTETTDRGSSSSSGSKRRKAAKPHRSLPSTLTEEQKRDLGVVKLDVYSVYKSDPSQLLSAREERLLKRQRVADESEEEEPARKVGRPPRRRGRGGKRPNVPSRPPYEGLSGQELTPKADGSTTGAPVVTWTKGDPLPIPPTTPYYDQLTPEEIATCSTLRLLPETYLKIKDTLLTAKAERGPFKKRDAQKWCRVDVNKTGKLYDWFVALGWLEAYEH